MKCFKCKKKLKKSEVKEGYNHTYCGNCFKKVSKQAKQEVKKMLNRAEKQGLF